MITGTSEPSMNCTCGNPLHSTTGTSTTVVEENTKTTLFKNWTTQENCNCGTPTEICTVSTRALSLHNGHAFGQVEKMDFAARERCWRVSWIPSPLSQVGQSCCRSVRRFLQCLDKFRVRRHLAHEGRSTRSERSSTSSAHQSE